MKLIMDNSWTYLDFEEDGYLTEIVDKKLRTGLGVREPGYQYSRFYKQRLWDGYTEVYDQNNKRFPTGLIHQAEDILGSLQERYAFQFEIVDDRPDPLMTEADVPESITFENGITLRDYQMESIREGIKNRNGIFHLSTGSGKSFTANGLIKLAMDKLEPDERIVFFVPKVDIYDQIKKGVEDSLGVEVGEVKSGKFNPKKVTIAMIPTVASSMSIDFEKGVKLTAKERLVKRMAKEVAPKYTRGKNQKQLLKSFIQNFKVKHKTDEKLLQEIDEIIHTSESDAKVKFKLNNYVAEYKNIIKKKNEDKYKKKERMREFLHSVILGIFDECHGITGNTYYDTIMHCENALIKIGLTGSIEEANPLLVQRLKGAFHAVVSRTTNHEMIGRGVLAKPTVMVAPIERVVIDGNEVDITYEKDYQQAYDTGIVQNSFRNALAAKMTQKWYEQDKVVVMVVSRIEHGERLSQLLERLNVPHAFIHGSSPSEDREQAIQDMRDGNLDVLLSSTIIDEGVDIPRLNVLVNVAGMKSLRQVLQRTGRVLRRKEGENRALVIDFDDKTNKYLRRHSEQRIGIYKDEKFELKYLGN